MISIKDIPKLTGWGNYNITLEWNYLGLWINTQLESGLQFTPDFQRNRVWSKEQKVKYIEFCLRGGKSGRDILFNCPNYVGSSDTLYNEFVLVDGLQRLSAVLDFLNNNLAVFNGNYIGDFTDLRRVILRGQRFNVYINDLQSKREVLEWYIELNSGGTPHSKKDIDRVKFILNNLEE